MAKEREPIVTFENKKPKIELCNSAFGMCELDGKFFVVVVKYDPVTKEAKVESLLHEDISKEEVQYRLKIEMGSSGLLS